MSKQHLAQMNLNLLLSLDAMLVEGSVTQAAKRLGITQSAMSRNLAALRALLDDDLLVRVGNTMQPTPYARSIKEELRHNLAALERLVRTKGTFDPAKATGTLRVAAPGHLGAIIAPRLINRIEAEAPALRVRIEHLDAARIVTALRDGVDIALGPTLDLGSAVDGVTIFQDRFACLVSATHPHIRGASIDLDAYLKCAHLIISPTGRGGSRVDAHLDHGERRVVAEVESFLLAPSIVARTNLVLTAPRSAMISFDDDPKLRVIAAPFELPALNIAAYWEPSRVDDPRVHWLLESIRASLSGVSA